MVPEIVTMNRAHTTHYTNNPDPGIRHVLRGWNPEGDAAQHDITMSDVRVRNIPTNIRDYGGGTAVYGNSIFVITKLKDSAGREYLGVQQKLVKLGETRGDLIAIEDGIKAGEEVVTSGVFKLRDHAEVQINNANTPSAEAAPRTPNT